MAVKRILFPLLALGIPGGVVGGLYWSTSQKAVKEYEQQLAKAHKLGVITTVADYKKRLPPESENAVPLLLKAADSLDWTTLPGHYSTVPIPFKSTDAAGPLLLEAANKGHAALDFDDPESVAQAVEKIDKAQVLLHRRIIGLASVGDKAQTEAHLIALARLRDLAAKSEFAPLAQISSAADNNLTRASLYVAAALGPDGVRMARSVLTSQPPAIDFAKANRVVPAYQLARIDELVEMAHSQNFASLAPFKSRSDVLRAKSEILAWAIKRSDPKNIDRSRGPLGEWSPQVTLYTGSPDYTVGRLFDLAFQQPRPMSLAWQEFPKGEVQEWFLRACEAGGKAPEGLAQSRDAHGSPLRFMALKSGYMVYSIGRNRVDDKGSKDDSFIRYGGGAVSGKR